MNFDALACLVFGLAALAVISMAFSPFAVHYARRMPQPEEPPRGNAWDFSTEDPLRKLTDRQLVYFAMFLLRDYGALLERDKELTGFFEITLHDKRTVSVSDIETVQGVWNLVTDQTL